MSSVGYNEAVGLVTQGLQPDQLTNGERKYKGRQLFPKHTCDITDREQKLCAIGFLMALQWVRQLDEPPSAEYVQALADMHDIDVPNMANGAALKLGKVD